MRKRLEDKVLALLTIEAQQLFQPGYCEDLAASVIDGELRMLARESIRHWEKSRVEGSEFLPSRRAKNVKS